MAHVFISYSTENRDYALKLAKRLRDERIDVWIDNDKIQSGAKWWQEIAKAVETADALIVIMTPAALASEWVQDEALLARNHKKPIFPVLLEGENWPLFVSTQFIDVRTSGRMPPQSFFDKVYSTVRGQSKAASNVSNSTHTSATLQNKNRLPWLDGLLRHPFLIALIGLIGAIGAALIVVSAQSQPTAPTSQPVPAATDTPPLTIAATATPQIVALLPTETLIPLPPTTANTVVVVTPTALSSAPETFTVNVARGRGVVVLTLDRPADLGDLVIDFGGNESYRLGDELSNSLISDVLCIRQQDSTTTVDDCTDVNTFTTGNTGNSWRNAEIIFAWRGSEIDRCIPQSTVTSGLYACDPLTLTF